MIEGPDAVLKLYDASSPISPEPKAMATATSIMLQTSRAHSLAAAAGSIIMPTAISVPSDWKPATRLSTTSARKMM